jgi:hypothetical protein
MDASLCGSRVTGNEIQDLLSKSSQVDTDHQKITHVEAELVGDQGATSRVFRATLTWSSNDHQLPKSLIIKAIGSDIFDEHFDGPMLEKLNAMKESIKPIHDTECCVYSVADLNKAVPMAKCFAAVKNTATQDGIIILEDLGDRGIVLPKTVLFGEGLNKGQVENLVDALATLHSWSLNTKVDWTSIVPPLTSESGIAQFAESVIPALEKAKTDYPATFENANEAKLTQMMNKHEFAKLFGCDPRTKFNLPKILVHGDIQPLNLLFKKGPTKGEIGDELVALLDWQIAHPGCGAEDVARVLGWCMSTENRREMRDQVVRRYVEVS